MTETEPTSRSRALSEQKIREHLEQFVPPKGSEPHVWIAPIGARADENDKWLDIGPLDAVCREYPRVGEILQNWYPHRSRNMGGILNLTPTLRCWVSLIGE